MQGTLGLSLRILDCSYRECSTFCGQYIDDERNDRSRIGVTPVRNFHDDEYA
jgi:hypothetical protein